MIWSLTIYFILISDIMVSFPATEACLFSILQINQVHCCLIIFEMLRKLLRFSYIHLWVSTQMSSLWRHILILLYPRLLPLVTIHHFPIYLPPDIQPELYISYKLCINWWVTNFISKNVSSMIKDFHQILTATSTLGYTHFNE